MLNRYLSLISEFNDFGSVAVMCGGFSEERRVSIDGGRAVYEALLGKGVEAKLIQIDKAEDVYKVRDSKMAFIVLHGAGDEDGRVQAICENLGVIYTGSSILPSALAIDKYRTKLIWSSMNLKSPRGFVVQADKLDTIESCISYPAIMKPQSYGSSIGIFFLEKASDLPVAIRSAKKLKVPFLVEQWIKGREYTATMLDNIILPFDQIFSPGGYTYEAKYTDGICEYSCPSDLGDKEKEFHKSILLAFELLGVDDYGRLDFIISNEGELFFLEANTIPGMTERSHTPRSAQAAGLSFTDLCIYILALALRRHRLRIPKP